MGFKLWAVKALRSWSFCDVMNALCLDLPMKMGFMWLCLQQNAGV